jgi:glycosyltransferase involved in cell wall biosynthesis
MNMRVSLLVSDFSQNCLGRVYILAKMLASEYEVEVVGPLFGDKVWPPCDTKEFTYKPVKSIPVFPEFLKSIRKIENLISGDIIYASKTWFSSFGIGILSKLKRKRPLILDVDDWELGWFLPFRFRKMVSLSLRTILVANGFLNTYFLERATFFANGITTASRVLQKKFGGEYIPHARDTEFLDPSKYDGSKIRMELGLGDEKTIMFLGSPKPHKGIGTILTALKLLNRCDVKLIIVGSTNEYPSKEEIPGEIAGSVVIKGMIPFVRIPEYLSCSDLVVVPQSNVPSNYAQVPAKLFDAMAMGKPVIASKISDLPEILRDCGFIVEPNNPKVLMEKIDFILKNPKEAKEVGRKARETCIQEYSLRVVGERLISHIQEVVE